MSILSRWKDLWPVIPEVLSTKTYVAAIKMETLESQWLDRDPKFSSFYARAAQLVDFSEENHDWFRRGGRLDYG